MGKVKNNFFENAPRLSVTGYDLYQKILSAAATIRRYSGSQIE
jgi:hypothetical protein